MFTRLFQSNNMELEDIFSTEIQVKKWMSKLIFLPAAGRILTVIFMKIIYKLYDIRAEQNMTVRELEKLSGVGKTTINRIENETGNPTVEIICKLAIALNCSPYDLFYMEN